MYLSPPATKLGQGYVFTDVCDSVHGGEGVVYSQGVPGPEGSAPRGVPGLEDLVRGGAETPHVTATAAGGMHPTGMHSCYSSCSFGNIWQISMLVTPGGLAPSPQGNPASATADGKFVCW